MANKLNSKEREIKSAIMDKLEDAVDEYFDRFHSKAGNRGDLPTINDIEDMLLNLRSKTREICLDMTSELLTNYDESKIIESKKENSEKEG